MLKKGCQMIGAALISSIVIIVPGWLGRMAFMVLFLYGLWLLRREGRAFQAGAALGVLYIVLSSGYKVIRLINGWESSNSIAYVLMVLLSCSLICVAWGVSKRVTGRWRYGLRALVVGYVLRIPLLAFLLRLMAVNIRVDSFWGQVLSLVPVGFSVFSILLSGAMGICLWRVMAEKTTRTPISPVVQP